MTSSSPTDSERPMATFPPTVPENAAAGWGE